MVNAIAFEAAAVAYIRSSLAQGHTLASYLRALPLEQGQVTALIPDTTLPDRLVQFEIGGVTTRAVMEPRMTTFITDYLRTTPGATALFEDELARPTDPFLASVAIPQRTYHDEVYYLLDKAHSAETDVIAALRRATSFVFIGALGAVADPAQLSQPLTKAALQTFAAGTQHLLVGAYDGESALVWSRVRRLMPS